jgi:AcrR family transcriptional regulator
MIVSKIDLVSSAETSHESAEPLESRGLSDRAIVRAAREIIAEVGVGGLTMRRLSTELGVALGATYHHVATKHGLLMLVGKDLYSEVTPPERMEGPWQDQLKTVMLNLASIVGCHPGMANFMMLHVDELIPVDLNVMVRDTLLEAGFSERSIAAVLSAFFFYVAGMMSTGSVVGPTATSIRGQNLMALFEDGLDVIVAGAEARLAEDRKQKRARR